MTPAVGIDFGTTSCVIAVYQGDRPTIIPNAEGGRSTSSVVMCDAAKRYIVGALAQRRALLHPEETISHVKRFLGCRYDDVAEYAQRLPFLLARGPNSAARIKVHDRHYTPEEMTAVQLRRMLDGAARQLGHTSEAAVLTVPASFTHTQRQALWDAARIAGLQELQLLSEPLAVALAYSLRPHRSETVLIVDMGSGTTEVALCEIGGGWCEARACIGEPGLGGDGIDECLIDLITERVQTEHGIDLRAVPNVLPRLYEAAERAKWNLSSGRRAIFQIPYLMAAGVTHLEVPLTRSQLEDAARPLLSRFKVLVERTLSCAGTSPADVDTVLLVGGGTRVPAFQHLLTGIFGNYARIVSVSADETVARGAAKQAALLWGGGASPPLFDILPLSLLVDAARGSVCLVEPQVPLPHRMEHTFSTAADNQTALELTIRQGTPASSDTEHYLGRLRVSGLHPAPSGAVQVRVTFDIDQNGLLSVEACDHDSGERLLTRLEDSPNLTGREVRQLKDAVLQQGAAE